LNNEAVVLSAVGRLSFRKFARRNKAAIATTSVVLAALVVGIVATTWQAVRATREHRGAELARREEAGQRAKAEQQRDRGAQGGATGGAAGREGQNSSREGQDRGREERQQRAEAEQQKRLAEETRPVLSSNVD